MSGDLSLRTWFYCNDTQNDRKKLSIKIFRAKTSKIFCLKVKKHTRKYTHTHRVRERHWLLYRPALRGRTYTHTHTQTNTQENMARKLYRTVTAFSSAGVWVKKCRARALYVCVCACVCVRPSVCVLTRRRAGTSIFRAIFSVCVCVLACVFVCKCVCVCPTLHGGPVQQSIRAIVLTTDWAGGGGLHACSAL